MSLHRWFESVPSPLALPLRKRRRARRHPPCARAHGTKLEVLEDRSLLAFAPAASYAVGASPQAVVTADFNGDTRDDVAVANYGSSDVSVLLSNADGTFQPAIKSPTGSNPLSVAVGDFNGNGTPDLVTVNAGGDVSVLLGVEDAAGNGTGSFSAPASIGLSSSPQSVAVGDFNGDGLLDLGVTSNAYYLERYYYCSYYGGCGYYYFGHYEGQANVLLGNGDGSFSAPNSTPLGYGYFISAAVANFNGDVSATGHAIQDLATINSYYGTVSVLLGDASGTLQAPTSFYAGYYPYSVAAGDVDGDGDNDLVTANFYGNNVSVLLGDGSGGFGAAVNYATGG